MSQEQFNFEVEYQWFYHPIARRYISVLDEGCFKNDEEYLQTIRTNLLKEYIPAVRVIVTFDEVKGADRCQWLAFLTSELRSDFKYREFEPQYFTRRTDKIKPDHKDRYEIKMELRRQFDEQLNNTMKQLSSLGFTTTCNTKESHITIQGQKYPINYPEDCNVPTDWYEEEKILIKGPRFEIYCNPDTQLYQVLEHAGIIGGTVTSCTVSDLRKNLEKQRDISELLNMLVLNCHNKSVRIFSTDGNFKVDIKKHEHGYYVTDLLVSGFRILDQRQLRAYLIFKSKDHELRIQC